MIYTGPVDTFFDYCYGKLPYRSLEFKHETHDAASVSVSAGSQLSERATLHARHRIQISDRSGTYEDQHCL